jgi:tetrapyrrole methylase family protein/MazG family protein
MAPYTEAELKEFSTLLEIMARLREPGGCPWDREQDSKSLRPYVLEEAYEVVEAIDSGTPDLLAEELGDLLLQIVFHARIGDEEGTYSIDDVIYSITSKLVRRHPHVFADLEVEDADEVLRNWNTIKRNEKEGKEDRSVLDGVPGVLPALLKAYTYSKRAAQVGFDWEKPADVIAKLREEIDELEQAVQENNPEQIEAELGDLFFGLANIARHLKANPELALERTNRKFRSRFNFVERRLSEKGSSPQESDLEEMETLWQESKKQEQ